MPFFGGSTFYPITVGKVVEFVASEVDQGVITVDVLVAW